MDSVFICCSISVNVGVIFSNYVEKNLNKSWLANEL